MICLLINYKYLREKRTGNSGAITFLKLQKMNLDLIKQLFLLLCIKH